MWPKPRLVQPLGAWDDGEFLRVGELCKNGHRLTPESIYLEPRTLREVCRTCRNQNKRKRRQCAQAA